MKGIRIGAFALVVLAVGFAIAGCGSSKTHGEEGTVTLTEPGGNSGSFGVIGKASENNVQPGNGFAFSSPLEDSAGKSVGELNAFCLATQPSPGEALGGTCSGTATVPGGGFALNAGGKEVLGGNVSGSIVGGTGKYAGAVGTFSSKEEGGGGGEEGPATLTFDYTLP